MNPLSYLIDAIRALMLARLADGEDLAGVPRGALVVGLITLPAAVIAFRRIVNS